MGTNRDFGNMLNEKYVKTQSPPKKKSKKKGFSPWEKMKSSKEY